MNRRTFIFASVLLGCVAGSLAAAEEPLPPAEKILDRYVEVTGGKAAHEKVKSAVITMTMNMPAQGMKASITSYVMEPDKMYVVTELPNIGTVEEGNLGNIGWSRSAMLGPRLKDGEEQAISLRSSSLRKDVEWRNYYKIAKVEGLESCDGKPCYKVTMTPTIGSNETRYYDKASGLMTKMQTVNKTPMGEMPAELSFSNYQKMGGLLTPTAIATKVAGNEMDMTIDKVEYNTEIPADKFKLPPDIQALVDKKNGGGAKAPQAK